MTREAESGLQAPTIRNRGAHAYPKGPERHFLTQPADPRTIGVPLTTLNRSLSRTRYQPATDRATQKSQIAGNPVDGRYTAVDTLTTGTTRHARRPGGYADVDTITRPTTTVALRPGSYIDVDGLSDCHPALGRPGSYTDVDSSAR